MSKKVRLDFWKKSFWKEQHLLTAGKRALTAIAGVSATGAGASAGLDLGELAMAITSITALVSTFGAVVAQIVEVWARATGRIKVTDDIDGNKET